MEAEIQSNDKDFLEQSLKFYKNIDKYSPRLDIDAQEVDAFKNDMKVFLFIADKRYRAFTEGFIRYNILILRTKLEHLFAVCSLSKGYTKRIGEELGMISPQHRISWPMGWAHKDVSLDVLVQPDYK